MTTKMSQPDREHEEFEALLFAYRVAKHRMIINESYYFMVDEQCHRFQMSSGNMAAAAARAERALNEWLAARGGCYVVDDTIYSTDGDDKIRISIPPMEQGS